MEKENKQEIVDCRHCGNKTLMNCLLIDEEKAGEDDWWGVNIHKVFKCPVCKNITLVRAYYTSEHDEGVDVMYPADNVDYMRVPKNIETAYQAAIRTKEIDKAICIQSLRRVLEMICKDKGESGDNLVKKISNLVNNNKLPEMVNDMCYIIRKLGNEAAHGDNTEFTSYDVEQLIKYVGLIIEYLYSLPRRIHLLKEDIDERHP